MVSNSRIFVPLNFTIEEGATLKLVNCNIIKYENNMIDSFNVFNDKFKGDVELVECNIYTEDEPVIFIDKIESYTNNEERIIL